MRRIVKSLNREIVKSVVIPREATEGSDEESLFYNYLQMRFLTFVRNDKNRLHAQKGGKRRMGNGKRGMVNGKRGMVCLMNN